MAGSKGGGEWGVMTSWVKGIFLGFICFCLFVLTVPLGMQNPSPPQVSNLMPSELEAWSLNHWTTREVPRVSFGSDEISCEVAQHCECNQCH